MAQYVLEDDQREKEMASSLNFRYFGVAGSTDKISLSVSF
jgi:hypothetical protein